MSLLDTTGHHETTALVVAQSKQPDDPGGRGEDFGKSSPVGLVLLILFFIAVVFLVRSMNKHLRKLPESFEKDTGQDTAKETSAEAEAPAEVKPEGKAEATQAPEKAEKA